MRQYVCPECGTEFPVTDRRYRCDCGGPLDLQKHVSFPSDQITQRKPTLWRYREVIPIENDENIVSFDEGMTPLVKWDYRDLNLLAKVDYLFPTGSYKDRGATVLLSLLKEIGVSHFIEDSSGNAGAALSAYAAQGGLTCEIFCPHYASVGKLSQIALYGARLRKIPGTRLDTTQAVLKSAKKQFYASHNWNPFFLEGVKTLAYEIAEQLGWEVPDNVISPLGYGGIILGLHLGFRELIDHNLLRRMPRLLGVQAEACCPIYQAYRRGSDYVETFNQKETTIAEGVCAAEPVRGKAILRVLNETQGAVTVVSENEIKEGIQDLAAAGLFVEPTSAVVVKAIDHFRDDGIIARGEKTVVVLTGSGLKALPEITNMYDRLSVGE